MHKIKIAKQQISNSGNFAIISDDYLIRPAQQDFWRLESDSNGGMTITRIISSSEEDGVPDVFEVETQSKIASSLRHNPNRLADPGVLPQLREIGLAVDGLFVFLDDKGFTYPVDKILGTPLYYTLNYRLKTLINQLVEIQKTLLGSTNDQGWASQYRAVSDLLLNRGPISIEGLDFRRLQGQIEDLIKALARKSQPSISNFEVADWDECEECNA